MTKFFRSALRFGLVMLLGSLSFAPVMAANFNEADRAEIGDIIKDYILKNPEVLRDALVELDRREAEAQSRAREEAVSSAAETLFNSKRQVELGNPQGDVTLVEFFDYNCGYCKRAMADVLRLLEEDKNLRVVLKEFPVLGEGSVEAASVAIAVNEIAPEKYMEFHKELLGGRGQANEARALDTVEKIGLDRQAIVTAMNASGEVRSTIEEVYSIANRLGLTGTPSFVVGNEVVMGAVGYEALKVKIASVRDCGATTC